MSPFGKTNLSAHPSEGPNAGPAAAISDGDGGRSGARGVALLMAVLLAGPLALPAVAAELRTPAVYAGERTSVGRLSATVVLAIRCLLDGEVVSSAKRGTVDFDRRRDEPVAAPMTGRTAIGMSAAVRTRVDLIDLPPPAIV